MPQFRTSDHVHINYQDLGQGQPVILIHGWPLNLSMWEYQIPTLLKAGHRVIAYDRRGFGLSDQPAGSYNYDRFADDLHELMNHLKVENAALVGFSMGGGEIARYIGKYGDARLSRVAFISSVAPFMLKTHDNPEGVDAKVFEDMKNGLKEDRPNFLSTFAKDFYGVSLLNHPVSQELLDWTAHNSYMASAWSSIDCVDAFGKTDFRADLSKVRVPTLIIHGKEDKTVPSKPTGEAAAKLIPHAHLKMYDGAPHGLFFTHKNPLNEDLLSFLKH